MKLTFFMKKETGIIIYIEQTVHKNNASNTVLFSHSFRRTENRKHSLDEDDFR